MSMQTFVVPTMFRKEATLQNIWCDPHNIYKKLRLKGKLKPIRHPKENLKVNEKIYHNLKNLFH